MEKEKEGLRHEVTRLQKQVTAASHIASQQEDEVEKLNSIISEADTERGRQAHELSVIVAERNLLQTQLVKRDEELSSMYEKLRVQRSSLANGAVTYAGAAAEREELVANIASLKGDIVVVRNQTADIDGLSSEARKLEADLLAERTKIRSLQDELHRPINVHRWRALADRDPQRWALLQRVHTLQQRLGEFDGKASAVDATITQREKELAELKVALARQPTADIRDVIAARRAELAAKGKQLRRAVVEVEAARARVGEFRAELSRINEVMDGLTVQYIRRQRNAQLASSSAAMNGQIAVAASSGDQQSKAAALAQLDVSSELLSAKMVSDGHGGLVMPAEDAAAVKAAADRILAALQ